MIVGVVGAAGGVGTSTFGLLLSVAISEQLDDVDDVEEAVFIEVDRAGGVVGARFEVGVESGVRSWVSGLATGPELSVSGFGKLVAERLRLVAGPEGCVEAERVLSTHAVELLAGAMAGDRSRRWIVDLGRGGSAVSSVIAKADAVVVVASGAQEEVVRLPSLVSWCRPTRCVVVLGDRAPWSADEVQRHCGADVVLAGEGLTLSNAAVVDLIEGRRRRRSRLWRTVLTCRDAVLSSPVPADHMQTRVS